MYVQACPQRLGDRMGGAPTQLVRMVGVCRAWDRGMSAIAARLVSYLDTPQGRRVAAGLLLLTALVGLVSWGRRAGDFAGYVEVGQALLSGQDPYRDTSGVNTWPPVFSFLCVPLAVMAKAGAYPVRVAWASVQLCGARRTGGDGGFCHRSWHTWCRSRMGHYAGCWVCATRSDVSLHCGQLRASTGQHCRRRVDTDGSLLGLAWPVPRRWCPCRGGGRNQAVAGRVRPVPGLAAALPRGSRRARRRCAAVAQSGRSRRMGRLLRLRVGVARCSDTRVGCGPR